MKLRKLVPIKSNFEAIRGIENLTSKTGVKTLCETCDFVNY